MVVGLTARCAVEPLTSFIFDLPKTEALERAYETLGINHNAQNHKVKEVYKKLILINHPDKGGDSTMFTNINVAYGIIKAARNM